MGKNLIKRYICFDKNLKGNTLPVNFETRATGRGHIVFTQLIAQAYITKAYFKTITALIKIADGLVLG